MKSFLSSLFSQRRWSALARLAVACFIGTIAPSVTASPPTGMGGSSLVKVSGGQSVVLTVAVTPGADPSSTGLTVTGDLSALGVPSSVTFHDDGLNGDAVVGDNVFSAQVTLPTSPVGGAMTVPIAISDAQGRNSSGSIPLGVLGSFKIFHVNDTHARLTPHQMIIPQHGTQAPVFEQVGGAAYLATAILHQTAANPNSLVIDAGDISEGNPIGDMNGNGSMVDYYKLLSSKLRSARGRGVDAVVVGNHDVRSLNYIANLKNQTDFSVISVNVCQTGTTTPYFSAYTTVTVNGTKIGILGYTTGASEVGADLAPTLQVVQCDWKSADTTKIHIADYVNTLRNTLGCDVVILAAHIGHSGLVDPAAPILQDTGDAKLPEIAVTGHWHTWTSTVWQPSILNYKTIFTESASYMKYLGELEVTGQGKYLNSVQHIIRDADFTPDPDVQALIANLETQYAASNPSHPLYDVIGYTADDLMLDNYMKWWSADEYPWSGDNTAGQWICDAMQWKAANMFAATGGCDLSIESGGGVRADVPKGAITYLQIYETFPWNDDLLNVVNMTGQEIWNYIKITNCGTGFSSALHVTAVDGNPTAITFNGAPLGLTATYKVAINNYMYVHPPTNFTWSDKAPQTSTYLCRDAIIEYTAQFDQDHPMKMGGPRYTLNTDFSGGYRAVVTMMNDNDTKTTFEDAFIRFLSATPETLARRPSTQVPAALVNPDGSVNPTNALSEAELYRSYLGFKTGALKPGDIIETWGKGSFYGGDPEFVDQEGIYADGVEFRIIGHDDFLAKPTFMPSIGSFWDSAHKNHYVKFLAKKTGTNYVADQTGQSIQVMDVTAYTAMTLPGNTGDFLWLTGVPTMESYGMRFRGNSATVATGITSFPPTSNIQSRVDPLPPGTTTPTITLTATANVAGGTGSWPLSPVADAQVQSGSPNSNYGKTTNLYVQSFATGTYGNERSWLKFDLSGLPSNASITAATLQLWCWKAGAVDLPTELRTGDSDTWTETGLTWNNQPTPTALLGTKTLTKNTINLWYNWDVTAYALGQSAGDKLVSLVVKPVSESASTAVAYVFDSKEFGSNAPVLLVTTTATSADATVGQVQYAYRYSSDNSNWGNWTPVSGGASTTAPYSVSFGFPSGYGYYEFYSIATDSNGLIEATPLAADAAVHYAATPAYATTGSVNLSDLNAIYDGAAKTVTAKTAPVGLSLNITYAGSPSAPIHAGSYSVVATVTDLGYPGSGSGTLTIGRAAQTLSFATIPAHAVGDPAFNLAATATSGLPVTYVSSNPAVATVSGNTVTIVGAGTTTLTASQTGDGDHFAATPIDQTLTVNASGAGSSGGSDVPAMPLWALVALLLTMIVLAIPTISGKRS